LKDYREGKKKKKDQEKQNVLITDFHQPWIRGLIFFEGSNSLKAVSTSATNNKKNVKVG